MMPPITTLARTVSSVCTYRCARRSCVDSARCGSCRSACAGGSRSARPATGPAGIGKTTVAKAICGEIPGTVYVCIDQETCSATGLIAAIYRALKQRPRRHFRPKLSDLVEGFGNSGRLLIIDQAHRLRDRALETLMDLHDNCALPILLIGTAELHRRVSDDEDPLFGQLASRVGVRLDLLAGLHVAGAGKPGPDSGTAAVSFSVADVRAIFARGKLKLHPDAANMLARIATYSVGHLRRAVRIFRWAEAIALRNSAAEITAAHVAAAAAMVAGEPLPTPPPTTGERIAERQEATA